MSKTISFTAFLVNESRNRLKKISKDQFAHLWINEEVQSAWDEFAKEVTPHDSIVISVRHAYFLDKASFSEITTSLKNLQPKGSVIAFDYWDPSFYQSAFFRRLEAFVEQSWGFSKSNYLFLTKDQASNLKDYQLIESSNGPMQEKDRIGSTHLSDVDNAMIEHYLVFEKN